MGIKDLLPTLKGLHRSVNVSIYSGKTIAIDGYCWLHQAAYYCALELVQFGINGPGRDKFVTSCKQKLDMVIKAGVRPIVVFDGNRLKMKDGVEVERQRNREEARRKADEFARSGDLAKAERYYNMAVDITPELANCFIRELRHHNIEFYVAPYEADAQLAYLFKNNFVQAVVTEDSDMLAFGVTDVLFKMDRSGNGIRIDMAELRTLPDFAGFNYDMLLYTCIISGCDYLESIKGVGLKKARQLVKDSGADIPAIMRKIRREGKYMIPLDYEESFQKALLTFKFQRVYDPEKKELVHLNNPDSLPELGKLLRGYQNVDWLGPDIDKDTAKRICLGELHPITRDCFRQIVPIMNQDGSAAGQMRVFARSNVQTRYKADLADPPKKKKEPKNTLMACFAKAREKQSATRDPLVAS